MMTQFGLRQPVGRSPRTSTRSAQPTVLRFPFEAVREMHAAKAGIVGAQTPAHEDLIRQIEATLDRMQSRVDDLRSQVSESYKFPAAKDFPPPRAA